MVPALIATIGVVIVALISTASELLSSRNDRALTHQEVDLLAKLDPQSKAARDLNEVIQARIGRWHARWYKTKVDKQSGARLAVTPKRLDPATIRFLFVVAAFAILLIILYTIPVSG